jgi:hypothetical protein
MVWFSTNIRFQQSNSQTYVKFLTSIIMKKSVFLSVFVVALTVFSVVSETMPQTASNHIVISGDIGGQSNQMPANPPKP